MDLVGEQDLGKSKVQKVSKFAAMRNRGIITQAEFMQQTAMAMDDTRTYGADTRTPDIAVAIPAGPSKITPGQTTKGAGGKLGIVLGAGNIVTEVAGALAACVHVGDQIMSIEGAVCPQSVDDTYALLRGAPTTFGIEVAAPTRAPTAPTAARR